MAALVAFSDLVGDFVVYRRLEPFDPRVPGVSTAWREMGLAGPVIVRKREPQYARVAVWILRRFHSLQAPGVEPAELLVIGDTIGNDGGAFTLLTTTTGWRGAAFIGADVPSQRPMTSWQGDIFIANRWQSLADWLEQLPGRGLALDERTIVIVDIDKTALGARGRNDRPIDATRLEGIRQTVLKSLGPEVSWETFAAIYEELNQPVYKNLTADNQDYLAYICLMTGAGIIRLEGLRRDYRSGALPDFSAFINQVHLMATNLPPALAAIHEAVYEAYRRNDPTPFKDFRRREYLAAVTHMGHLPDDVPEEVRLREEICLTREVWDACRWLQARGAVLTSLSDKPDEACAPTPELAAQGYRPIHRQPTHLAGQPLGL